MGEKEPRDDFSLTHGICETCVRLKVMDDPKKMRAARNLRDEYEDIRESIAKRNFTHVRTLLSTLALTRPKPVDFLLGILQPTLSEVGKLWESGRITIADQHEYSALCDEVLEAVRMMPEYQRFRQHPEPTIILALSPRSRHGFGLDVVELFLMVNCIPSFRLSSTSNIIEAVTVMRPRYVGLSVSLPRLVPAALAVADKVFQQTGTKTLLGGGGSRDMPLRVASSATVVSDIRELPEILGGTSAS